MKALLLRVLNYCVKVLSENPVDAIGYPLTRVPTVARDGAPAPFTYPEREGSTAYYHDHPHEARYPFLYLKP